MPQVQYFDRSGRVLSKREAFEADGKTIRDGVRCRVPHHLADSAVRLTDARAFWDQHRDSLLVVDARRIGGTEGNKPGYRVFDDDRGRQAIADARADYIRDLESAYRDAAPAGSYPYRQSSEGSACTVDGRPGRLVREGSSLVCRPIGADARTVSAQTCPNCDGNGTDEDGDDCETCGGSGRLPDDNNGDERSSATSDHRSIDQIARDHFAVMERLYAARNREISEAWREGKASNG